MKYELKILDRDYLEDIIAFDEMCFGKGHWKTGDWKELIEDSRAVYYAFMDEEKIIAAAFIYNWKGEKDYIKLMNISVHPQYRKSGLASSLLEVIKQELKESGLNRIAGETRESNKAMQKVFESSGFTLNKIEPDCYTDPAESGYKYIFTAKKIQ